MSRNIPGGIARYNSAVFTPGRIGSLTIKNRLVRSATNENACDGEVSDTMIQIHRNLALGGVGLIITGIAWVDPSMPAHRMTRVDNDSFIPGLRKLTHTVHDADPGCRIMLQLHHPGRQVVLPGDMPKMLGVTPPAFMAYLEKHREVLEPDPEHGDIHLPEPVAPSAIYDTFFKRTPRALSTEEVEKLIDAYVEGIRRAQEAGFDGVQIHAAHGWLLSTFLSPRTNKREDRYGGSVENRTRILRDIYTKAIKKVGHSFAILVKFNATDLMPGGIELEEGIQIARILSETGYDALEVSGGMWEVFTRNKKELGFTPLAVPEARVGIKSKQEGYNLPLARAIKEATGATVMSIGGHRSFSAIEKALEAEATDFVSLARPLVRQPDLPYLWLSGKGADRAGCISCSACMVAAKLPLFCRAPKKTDGV